MFFLACITPHEMALPLRVIFIFDDLPHWVVGVHFLCFLFQFGFTEHHDKAYELAREKLADYAHAAWSGWMKYMFSKSTKDGSGLVMIPASLVERWTRQMNTPYTELPENEKESDRLEADRMIEIYES